MKTFKDKIAVVTGGGTGMGREIARKLAADGCHVSMCDVSADEMEKTRALCLENAPPATRVTTFVADVSVEEQVLAFRDAVVRDQDSEHVHLLFNNAGIGGGGSFVTDRREEWEKVFAVCWYGVYFCTRAFLPLLITAEEAHLVNTSSVNGFWASLGPQTPHTAYSAAKFAVKGFSEALITDLRISAPHVKVSVVMPGYIGTSIVINSGKVLGMEPESLSEEDLQRVRVRMERMGVDPSDMSADQLRQAVAMQGQLFRDSAPTSAAQAADVILEGVRAERWRILIGDDAVGMDELVREKPEEAYESEFFAELMGRVGWGFGR